MVIKRFISTIMLIIFFTTGFFMGKYYSNSIDKDRNKVEELSVDVSGYGIDNKKALEKVVPDGTEIIFQISQGNKYIVERINTIKEENLSGKKGKDIEEAYKAFGYVLKSITDNRIELVRKPVVYLPNRYVLLVENNEIIISKSDSNGNIFDEMGNIIGKEGTGAKITSLKPQDIANIIKAHESLQFKTIEELNDGIKDFDIKYEMLE